MNVCWMLSLAALATATIIGRGEMEMVKATIVADEVEMIEAAAAAVVVDEVDGAVDQVAVEAEVDVAAEAVDPEVEEVAAATTTTTTTIAVTRNVLIALLHTLTWLLFP